MLLLGYFSGTIINAKPPTANFGANEPSDVQQASQIRLTTSIVSQKYCDGDAEVDVLQMRLQLCYTNVGKQRLIFYKNGNLILRQMVSRNLRAATAGQYELDGSITTLTSDDLKDVEEPVPGTAFVILQPGDTYKTKADIAIAVADTNLKQITGTLTAGDYLLQVTVGTWPELRSLGDKLHKRWRGSGFLWLDPITSTPMPFKVNKKRSAVTCS